MIGEITLQRRGSCASHHPVGLERHALRRRGGGPGRHERDARPPGPAPSSGPGAYRDIFTFPVREYYTAAGLDLSAEPFEPLAVEWTGLYHRFYPRCGLFPATREVLQAVGEMGLEQAIVSASHQQALDSQVEEQGLDGFFQARLGISDIYAGSKAGLAQRYLKSQGVLPEQALFVGDTLHDWEVAQEAGCPCVLLAQGHQSRTRLETAGVPVLESLIQVPAFLRGLQA